MDTPENSPVSFAQAAAIIRRYHGLDISRMTLWRWSKKGLKLPVEQKLHSFLPEGNSRKRKTTMKDVNGFLSKAEMI